MPLDPRLAAKSLDFLEAAYAWERPSEEWLTEVVAALCRVWGGPAWGFGFAYDASDITRFTSDNLVFWKSPTTLQSMFRQTLAQMAPDFVASTYRTLTFGFVNPFVSRSDAPLRALTESLRDFGTQDMFALNTLDPSGIGCVIGLGSERTVIAPDEMVLFHRLAAHLASAYRCRRALKALATSPLDEAEAILKPDGGLLDARGAAREASARNALGAATRSMEGVRRRTHDDEPTIHWRPRVGTRWTLVDAFSKDGERFIVARENQAHVRGLEALTEREQQVVACAAGGSTNKEIAYDLGISHATTRVLLARACRRLGVRSREDLLRLPTIRALRGEFPS